MKEYKLSIVGTTDFIIISPEILRLLLQKIKESPSKQIEIAATSIMPSEYTKYLERMLNSNRDKKLFRFKQIRESELKEEHIYQILETQMKNLQIEQNGCFEYFTLFAEGSKEKYRYHLGTERSFFYICHDEESRFTYVFPDGRQESVVLDWKKE
ncbi:hypothetical protein C806_02362 [Lachnospiraceae bacterium 3-1]|nr:hypothetical protein C806_02362 [Lachnospiraceae bacterium 3-1]